MLGKSRTQTATDSGNRRYDLPGASLRGPYKLWIPKTDNRHSESENEGPRAAPSNTHRPHGHQGSTTHVAAGNTATTSASTARHANVAGSTQHAAPAPQKQRSTDRHPVGYSSESTVHPPATTSKSSFSLFKPHIKESRGHSNRTTKREELPRSTTASAAVPSKHTTSQIASAPQKYTSRNTPLQSTAYVSNSTPSSTDPSPRSSTDSGPRNGNVSAPAATPNYPDPHKQGQSTWNPYVDARIDRTSTSRRNESSSALPRREEKKSKDREDMVARVTEALGGGSTGKAKAAENILLNNQTQTVKREDINSTRRTMSTGTRGVETQPYSQPQATQSSHRHRATPQATPFPGDARLPEHSSKSSRTHAEVASRAPEPPPKVSSHSKVPATSSSRVPHSRTASSPWPFNQALPPEQVMPPSRPQNHSSSWKSFARFQGSSTHHTQDPHPPPKESTQYPSSRAHADELGRTAPQAHTSAPQQQSSKSSLNRGIQTSATTSTTAPPRTIPPPAPAPAPPPLLPTQTRTNTSYASTSMEQPQRWSPSSLAPGRPTHQPLGTPQTPISKPPEKGPDPSPAPTPTPPIRRESTTASGSVPTAAQRSANDSNVGLQESRSPWPTSSKYPETRTEVQVLDSATATHGRYLTPNSGGGSNVGMQSSSGARSPWPTTSRHPEPRHEPPTPPELATLAQGRYLTTTTGTGSNVGVQPHNDSKSPWTSMSKHSEQRNEAPTPTEPMSVAPGRHLASHTGTGSNVGMQPHGDSKPFWPTTPKNPEPHHAAPTPHEPASFVNSRHPPISALPAPTVPAQAVGRSASASTSNLLWTTSPRHPETVDPFVTSEAKPISNVRNDKGVLTPAPGTWTSKYTQETYPASDSETDYIPKESTSHSAGTTGNQINLHQHTGDSDRLVPGAWTSRYATANVSASTFEAVPPHKPSPKEGLGPGSTTYKYGSATPAVPEPTNREIRPVFTHTVPTNNQPVTNAPGAWTTSSRYATNASGSIFDSSPSAKNGNPASRESPPRQAMLGTTPVAGAWTTKPAPGSSTPSSEGTVRQTPVSQTPVTNAPASSSLLKPPPPASGTNTGTSTPSSTQVSDLINQLSPVTSHSIATRVPISGHPSTPAPVRPVLRATPPPLSISSTSPDTDSLLTPSSLNSPRSTFALPPSQPVSTTTSAYVQQPSEKDVAPRKNGFFDFFRPKPSLKTYEVWTPPPRTKDKERQKEPSPPPKQKQSAPLPIPPRPKSPRVFSPFKLFSKRRRTLSSASIDVLDGTAGNTLMNSPASSMRADTPGGPPSPPLRDAFLATQEWRNKEATELVVSGRKRRHRPGVVFDCPEDSAPVDILPSRLRIGRVQNDYDEE